MAVLSFVAATVGLLLSLVGGVVFCAGAFGALVVDFSTMPISTWVTIPQSDKLRVTMLKCMLNGDQDLDVPDSISSIPECQAEKFAQLGCIGVIFLVLLAILAVVFLLAILCSIDTMKAAISHLSAITAAFSLVALVAALQFFYNIGRFNWIDCSDISPGTAAMTLFSKGLLCISNSPFDQVFQYPQLELLVNFFHCTMTGVPICLVGLIVLNFGCSNFFGASRGKWTQDSGPL